MGSFVLTYLNHPDSSDTRDGLTDCAISGEPMDCAPSPSTSSPGDNDSGVVGVSNSFLSEHDQLVSQWARCILSRITMKLRRRVLGHPLPHSLAPVTHSLAPPASLVRSARALRCAHSLPHSGVHGKEAFVHELEASISSSFNPRWCLRECRCGMQSVCLL